MKLRSVAIADFKRFTQLTVTGLPQTARLIILAGPNGSGKSSFFDALHRWHSLSSRGEAWSDDYHMKVGVHKIQQWKEDQLDVRFHTQFSEQDKKKLIYVRSAYRNDPEYQTQSLKKLANPLDERRVNRMIDNDAAIGRNYQRLAAQVFDIFETTPQMTDQFIERIIAPIRAPLQRLFPSLVLNDLANPLTDGTFRFTKGKSRGFNFKNLSGGEKAAFDLILDLAIATRAYDNTVFCIDEPESHMNGRLQAELLSVLYSQVPDNCQLVLATHSISIMRRARDIAAQQPGSVVFLDFDGHDFDQPVTITPAKVDTAFWTSVYDVALDDLAALVAPERVVICEGEPQTRNVRKHYSHDARCYDKIFQEEFPETQFVPGGSASEVVDDKRGIAYVLGVLTQGTEVVRLVDRDARSPDERSELIRRGVRVLSKRNLESYLFDDEVLRALAASVDKEDRADILLSEKERIRDARPGDAPDDLKPSSGEIYLACKRYLELTAPGNDTKTFMRDTLAPLITSSMQVYSELKRDIFD